MGPLRAQITSPEALVQWAKPTRSRFTQVDSHWAPICKWWRPGGATPRPHAPMPKARGGGREEQSPRPRSGGCPGTGGPRGAIPRWTSKRAVVRRYPLCKVRETQVRWYMLQEGIREQTHWNHIQTSQSNHTRTTALSNSMKLSHAHGATKDRRVMVERSDRMWPTGEGNVNHFSILALRTPWTVWKGKMIGYWKRNSPGQ